MTQVSNGNQEIQVNVKDNIYQVHLLPTQYKNSGKDVINEILDADSLLLPGKLVAIDDAQAEIDYSLPVGAQSLNVAKKSMKYSERIALAARLNVLNDWQDSNINLFISPKNIFVVNGFIKVAHRGFENIITPESENSDSFLSQFKALVISLISNKYQFEDLVAGTKGINESFEKKISEAKSTAEITDLLQQKYRKTTSNQIPVEKKKFSFYKYGFIAAAIIAIVTLGVVGYIFGIKEPAQNRVIDSQAAFMTKNYDETTRILKNDNPKSLSKSAQYILATSYINLDSLTTKQKETILNNISPSSETNTLLYWIYTGRGDFKTALDLAQNLGDNQLVLYSYTKLYDVTQADHKMEGGKKQKLLKSYKDNINKLVKKLGGKTNGIEK